jgi:hypothetical protein
VVTGTLALLVPGVSYATASQSSPATATVATAATADAAAGTVGCRGVTPAVIPALGFITNPSRTQAGHLWWRPEAGGICIGTVIEWVQYNTTATKTWRVIVYSAQDPDGQVVAERMTPSGCRACTSARDATRGRLPGVAHGRRRSVALATFAMITANGGITSATADTMIAAVVEYRSRTAQDRTNKPMQTVMSTR